MPRPRARAQLLLRSCAETMPLTAKVAATAIDWSAGDHRLRPSSARISMPAPTTARSPPADSPPTPSRASPRSSRSDGRASPTASAMACRKCSPTGTSRSSRSPTSGERAGRGATYCRQSRALIVAETNPNHTAMMTGAHRRNRPASPPPSAGRLPGRCMTRPHAFLGCVIVVLSRFQVGMNARREAL
jgi:hypothetical protein